MKIKIDSEITISGPNKDVLDYCKKELTMVNPDIQKKKAMGFWTGNLPKEIKMYSKNGYNIVIPIGCIDDIWKMYPYQSEYYIDFGNHQKLQFPENKITPYPYQEKAIQAMIKAKRGILNARCGSGKSIMALEIIRRIGYKALIICHTKELLNQFKDYLVNDLGMPKGDYGIIASGKVEIGNLVTIALRQTIVNIDLLKYKYEWGTIVVDECVSGDTEILTEKGFVRFDKLEKGIKVAQFNNDRTIGFVKPLRYIEKDCKSYISFKNNNIELFFSENHDIVYEDSENNIKKRKASSYLDKNLSEDTIINCGIVKDDLTQKLSSLDKIGIMLQADGTVYYKGKETTTWKLEFSKERKIKEFKKLCEEAGIEYKEYNVRKFNKENWNDSYKFTIKLPNKDYKLLTNFLEIPKNIEYAKEIIYEISKWDAHWRKDGILEFDGTIYENIKFISTVAFLANIKCSKIITIKRKTKKHKEIYRLYLYKKQKIHYNKFDKKRICENKKMYCVEVPSNMIVCRKDDFIFVTGNCHNIAGNVTYVSQYQKILSHLAAEYRFGLSATAFRADGLTKCMYALTNKVKYVVEESEIADKIIKAVIQPIYTDYEIPEYAQNVDGTLDYTKMPTVLAEDKDRNKLILDLLKENKDNYCLVLSDRLTGLKQLHEELGEGLLIDGSQTTKAAKKEREEAIEKMRNKEEHYLFATLQLAREGLDIRPLNRLFLIAPTKNKGVLIQAVGRIERKDTNKQTPIVYDFVDKDIYYEKSFKSRKTIYKKNGNKILNIFDTTIDNSLF